MTNSTLIFIPDISGFTDFVNKTEINHSRHIISELLEIIINSDKLGMKVSEIEGDAVLFFKEGSPSVSDLIEQSRRTFLNFHNHLRRYDTERICRCGACETASKLSLKFVVHKGNVQKINIKEHQKLHGADVILAHKLLKNSISEHEYILISNHFENEISSIENRITKEDYIRKGSDVYGNLGDISYSYIPIKNLLDELDEPTQTIIPELSHNKVRFESTINAPVGRIYENFTNLEKRMKWNEEIKDIIMQGNSLNKVGSLHKCLVDPYSLDIESLGRLENNGKIVYGERLNEFKGLRDIITIYTFEKRGAQTHVIAEVDFKINSWLGKLMKPMIRKMLIKQTSKGLQKLKKVSEESEE